VRIKLITLTVALMLGVGLVACGDDEEPADTGAAPAEQTPVPEDTDPAELAQQISKDLDSRPQVPAPQGQPPADLVVEDVVKGKGRAAKPGATVSVQYVGVAWSTGQEFDASWNTGQPLNFPLGAGRVIQGWDQGVAGMRKGGRRLLVIPPLMAYGPAGQPPAIGPNETLVFVVDMVDPRA
jgi:peptidylprolyl isomerase